MERILTAYRHAAGVYTVIINGEEFGLATLDPESKLWGWSAFTESLGFGGETATLSEAMEEIYSAYQQAHDARS